MVQTEGGEMKVILIAGILSMSIAIFGMCTLGTIEFVAALLTEKDTMFNVFGILFLPVSVFGGLIYCRNIIKFIKYVNKKGV
jgi:hypothetical protein